MPGRPVEVFPEPTSPTIVDETAVARPAAPLPSPLLAMPPPEGMQLLAARARRLGRRAAPYLLCIVVGLAVGSVIHRSATPPPVAAPAPAQSVPPRVAPPPVAPPVVAKPAPPPVVAPVPAKPAPPPVAVPVVAKREPVAAPTEAKPEPAPVAVPIEPKREPAHRRVAAAEVDPDARPAAGAGRCSAKIVTEPDDAKVLWRGELLGKSPLVGARIPCGAGTLTISHERYETVTRELTAETRAPLAISERLHRPAATLVVVSSPPGATITVNGQSLGAAPRKLPTARYEHVSIRASLPGYATWTKKVYLTEATTKVTAQLTGRGR